MKKNDWHLRISLTDLCNFRCIYCNPEGLKSNKKTISANEIMDILGAAKKNGIKRIHWTGGEPLIFKDGNTNIVSLVEAATNLGYEDQVITTNGSLFHKYAKRLLSAGLKRVNISIDSLDADRNKELTGRDHLNNTLKSLETAVNIYPSITKMNVVAMQDTVKELPAMVEFASSIISTPHSKGNIAIKLIEICPNNPAQLQTEGEKFYVGQHIGRKELMGVMEKIGPLERLSKEEIDGDNPNAHYYSIGDSGVSVGFVTMPSTGWPCGKDYCNKFRITPYGGAAICLQKPIVPLLNLNNDELSDTIKSMMDERASLDKTKPNRIHFRQQLGEMRFGNLDGKYETKPPEYFVEICKKNVV